MAFPLWSDRHRDPSYLWPASAIAALVFHGLGLGWFMVHANGGETAPPAKVALVPVGPAGASQSSSLPPVALPTAQPFEQAPSTVTPRPTGEGDEAPVPEAAGNTAPSPAPTAPATASPDPAPRPSPPPSPPTPTNNGTEGNGAGNGDRGDGTGRGLQSWWSLDRLPGGRDVPDNPPQLPSGWQIRGLQASDYPQCLSNDLLSRPLPATVGLQLTVSAQGDIVEAVVAETSGNEVYDRAMTCVVKSSPFTLEPATSRDPATGEYVPVPTDAVLLTVTATLAPGS
jgi:hypothetical protein